jgi:lipoprotein signal peptidase
VYYWPGQLFPAFNVADSCICVGAVLLGWFSLRAGKSG